MPAPAAAGRNRSLAAAAAAAAFAHFLVPPKSTRLSFAPRQAPGLRQLGAHVEPVDTTLTRTTWWLVPLPYGRLVAWYAARTPADVRSTYPPSSTSPVPQGEFYWFTTDRSAAYSTPVEVIGYARLGAHLTAIRTDVTLAARADRTAQTLVPPTTTSMDITKRAIDGDDTSPRTVTVTDPGRVRSVVQAFDGLSGAYDSVNPHGCGSPAGIVYTYAVTFRWPDHTLVVDAGAALCNVGRGLTRDGYHLPQTLQDKPELDDALSTAFGG